MLKLASRILITLSICIVGCVGASRSPKICNGDGYYYKHYRAVRAAVMEQLHRIKDIDRIYIILTDIEIVGAVCFKPIAYGCYLADSRTAYISNNMSHDHTDMTVLHEMTHSILHRNGIDVSRHHNDYKNRFKAILNRAKYIFKYGN